MKYKITFIKGDDSYSWDVLSLSYIIMDLIEAKLIKGYYCKIQKL
jgi:hypothetical protein